MSAKATELEMEIAQSKKAEQALKASEKRYRILIENANEIIIVAQEERLKFVNPETIQTLGYSKEELTSKPFIEFIHPDDRKIVLENHLKRLNGKDFPHIYPCRVIDKNGNTKWFEINAVLINWEGKPATLNFLRDITESKKVEEKLRESEERYRAIFEQAADSIVLIDTETGTLMEFNDRAHESLGYTHREFQKLKISGFDAIESTEQIAEHIKKLTREGSDVFETQHRTKSGKIKNILVSVRVIPIGGKKIALSIWRDITERKQNEEKLFYMATHDILTNLPNRALFNDNLNLAIAHAHRNQQKLAVMMLDLDYFKNVNDVLGHSVGDKLLQGVGNRLKSMLRGSDTVARIGGDEFLLLLPEVNQIEDTTKIAQKILRVFQQPFMIDTHKISITVSTGIVIYPMDGEDIDILISHADIAMYSAKRSGRNNYQYYTA